MVEEALKEICAHARPGSILLANERARCCNYESLKELKDYTVISIEDLKRHDPPEKNDLLSNLGKIHLIHTFFQSLKCILILILFSYFL